MPDGWIKPGYRADPPAFDPVHGEQLSTPGFEAKCFQPTSRGEPVDVVIPLGRGSRHGDAELRYALRSIERHVEGLSRVWIVGERPGWLVVDGETLIHLPVPDICPIADVAIFHKLAVACVGVAGRPRVSERFVFLSDDQLLLRPLAWPQFGPYTWGDLTRLTRWDGAWWQRMRHTRNLLAAHGKPTLHGDTHAPVPMLREQVLRVSRETDWRKPPGLCVGTLYLNWSGARVKPLGHRKATVSSPLPAEEIRRRIGGRWFLCHTNPGFTPELRALLDELFPEPSRFEREQREQFTGGPNSETIAPERHGTRTARTIAVCNPSPTLSIIIPTIGRPTLRRTLESIRQQQLVDGDEVIVVQDGPADEATEEVVKRSGLPIRHLALDRRYADFGGTPRNQGMAEARGEYLAFIDDDDVYRPGAFDAIRRAIERHPDRPLMFRMERPGWDVPLWRTKEVRLGNLSTEMFISPRDPQRLGIWGSYPASDLAFTVTTLEHYPVGSLVWSPEIIAASPDRGMTATAPPLRRNLIYHVYAFAGNAEWRLNVQRLLRSWDLFNGRKIIGIVTDAQTAESSEVQAAFPRDASIEWLIQPNDRRRGEAVTFVPAAERLRSYSSAEATFYAHTKGTSPRFAGKDAANLASVRRWRNFMYRACLEGDPVQLDAALRNYAAAGSLRAFKAGRAERRRPPWAWQFAGTFWWFNHARFFAHPEALTIGPSRWGLERHLGEIFAPKEVCCLAGDHAEAFVDNFGLYRAHPAKWDVLESKAFGVPSPRSMPTAIRQRTLDTADRMAIARLLMGELCRGRSKLLDLGAGHCDFSILAAELGMQVTAVDARTVRVPEGLPASVRFIQGNFLELDIDPRDFDVILMLGIFYHLKVNEQERLLAKYHGVDVLLDTHYSSETDATQRGEYEGRYYDEANDMESLRAEPQSSWTTLESFWHTEASLMRILSPHFSAVTKILPDFMRERTFFICQS